jgi:hypothetical protein
MRDPFLDGDPIAANYVIEHAGSLPVPGKPARKLTPHESATRLRIECAMIVRLKLTTGGDQGGKPVQQSLICLLVGIT